MAHRPEDIRNIALIGHGGTGKTAIIDALAFATGASTRHGNTADGTSVGDTEPEEKERRHTLTSHVFGFDYDGHRLNIIDTPGNADFIADAISALYVAECALICIDAHSGPTVHAIRLFEEAGKAGTGRALVLTHPDADNVDFQAVLQRLNDEISDTIVPVTYPDADGAAFREIRDVESGQGPRASEFRERLEERVAMSDDAILEKYLETGTMSHEQFLEYLPRAITKQTVTPLFVVAPPKDIGLKKMLAFVNQYFPSPVAFGGRGAMSAGSDSVDQIVEPDPSGPFAGVVFKVVADPYVGRQSYIRCLRGTLKADEGLFNVAADKHEKLAGLTEMHGAEAKATDSVTVGDLFVVSKLESLGLGDTVTADGAALQIPRVAYPKPVFSLAVNPASRGDEQKINQGLEKLSAEDPTFVSSRDAQTGEHLIGGTSPMHLEIQLARLKRRYGVATETHPPAIPYRETMTAPAEGHHRHKKQSGGRGQFAEVYLRARPLDRGVGFEYIDSVVGGSIPRQFIPEVEKGVKRFMAKGPLTGSVVVDVAAELYDGKFHDVDSDQLSFQLAGERAFADAFEKGRPILLEPIMNVQIRIPERFTGDVTSNLSTHRGRMSGMEMDGALQVITAQVPMKEMQDYATQLRSMTAGEGTFTMDPSHYEPVPANVQQDIVAAHKKAQEKA
ncbi:MAG: elongation factor G [Planctomycetes bacterium]|nr:elongation factor G [Planctomycetota bacterium]